MARYALTTSTAISGRQYDTGLFAGKLLGVEGFDAKLMELPV